MAADDLLPRLRPVGPLVLDLFHRDGRIGERWLGLYPREFEVLWRLAEAGGQVVSRAELLADVWRTMHRPGSNRVEVAISRIRAKLHVHRLAALVVTCPGEGYLLAARPGAAGAAASALDSGRNLREPAVRPPMRQEGYDAVSRQ